MTKTDVKLAWGKVGDELSGLGLKLKYHAQEEFSEHDDDDGADVKDALKRLADAIEDTVDTAENVVKDPAVREDVRDTGRLLIDALATTLNEAVTACRAAADRNDASSPPPAPIAEESVEGSSSGT